jgi:hypothetical protein
VGVAQNLGEYGVAAFRGYFFYEVSNMWWFLLFFFAHVCTAMEICVEKPFESVLCERFGLKDLSAVNSVQQNQEVFKNVLSKLRNERSGFLTVRCYQVAFGEMLARLDSSYRSFMDTNIDNLHRTFSSLTSLRDIFLDIDRRLHVAHDVLSCCKINDNYMKLQCEVALVSVIEKYYHAIEVQYNRSICSPARKRLAQEEKIEWQEAYKRLLITFNPLLV